jgi:hypothetical protein
MSFNPRRRSGRGFMSSGWSQQPSQSIFNMNPLDFISNLVSPMLDIVSPLEDIKNLMSQGARMYRQTPSVLPKIVQKQWTRKTTPSSVKRGGQLLPQKYRIVIDCTGICDPNTLRTNIKRVQDNKHLIVSSDLKKGCQFKRSYTLPHECETAKMTKYVTPQGQLVIEFNYMDVPLSLAIVPQHEICTTAEHGKCVHVRVPVADFVEPAKVKVHVKGRNLFVHFEERIVPFGDFCSRVIYHTRIQLPQNVNLNTITAKSDKHKLTILAPIGVKKGVTAPISQQLRDIAVKRKLRHRKARAVSVGAEEKQKVSPVVSGEKKPQVQPSIGKKQKKTPLETPVTKPETPISGQQVPTISKKQQKKQALLGKKPEEQQKPSILKPEEKLKELEKKQPQEQKPSVTAEQLPGVTSEEKKKKKKKSKKLTATTMPISTPTSTTTTSTTPAPTPISEEQRKEPSPVDVDVGSRKIEERGPAEKERSPVRTTEKGSDILKGIFESGGESSQQQQQGGQSTTSATQSSSERVPEERQQQIGVSGSMRL